MRQSIRLANILKNSNLRNKHNIDYQVDIVNNKYVRNTVNCKPPFNCLIDALHHLNFHSRYRALRKSIDHILYIIIDNRLYIEVCRLRGVVEKDKTGLTVPPGRPPFALI